jgi:DNA-binding transcriptional ArsR family regulator
MDRALEAALSAPVSEVKAELFKALGHPARIRVLEVLSEGERSVSEMQPLVGIESSHLSQQLGILRRAGLVTTRKEGASVIYSLVDPTLSSLVHTEGLLADLRTAQR